MSNTLLHKPKNRDVSVLFEDLKAFPFGFFLSITVSTFKAVLLDLNVGCILFPLLQDPEASHKGPDAWWLVWWIMETHLVSAAAAAFFLHNVGWDRQKEAGHQSGFSTRAVASRLDGGDESRLLFGAL